MSDAPDILIARQLQMLGDLAEIGLEVARAVERRAKAAGPDEDLNALAMAYSRVARAVRQTIMLQSKLLEDGKDAVEAAAQNRARQHPLYVRKARIERIVERIAEDACGDDEDEVDRLVVEAGERLDFEDYGDILSRPIPEVVALICKDLGLQFDPAEFAHEAWAQGETLSYASSPASGGGGPEGRRGHSAAAAEGGVPPPLSFQPPD